MNSQFPPTLTKEPYNEIIEVSPELALKWLEGNTHNRPINHAHVNALVRDIKAGRWRVTHQGIAFDAEGLLIDGQHRLWAIVEANQAVRVRAFYNEPLENKQFVDCGKRRTNLDILHLTGDLGEVTDRQLATLRAMLAGQSGTSLRMTPSEEAEQYRRHHEAVDFAIRHLGNSRVKGIATATVRAVIARAYYYVNPEDLKHFCDVLQSGLATTNADVSVSMLFQFLLRTSEACKKDSIRRLRYMKTEWALDAYLDGKHPKRLCGSNDELFPLPEETSQRESAA
jgi:hypothetical protein